MPEGDKVWLAGRRLHAALAGRALTRTDFRVPRLATTDLSGRVVREVVSRGKHLLIRVEGGHTVHTHFRMEGSWHLYPPGERWRGGPTWQVRLVLANPEWLAVGYRLPVVELVPTSGEAVTVGHLGPDLLGVDWSLDEALRRLRADPQREIGQALLDQRNLAGIGNLYKTEVLFLHGVSPWTPVGDVPHLDRLVERSQTLLLTNRETWSQVTTPDARRGQEHWVFERTGRPCRRCGTGIAMAWQGRAPHDRLAYWCPRCQSGPAPPPLRRGALPARTIGTRRYRP